MDPHNRLQLEYFGGRLKRTMVPRDTPYVRNHLRRTLEAARVGRADRLLEIGCGMGRYTIPLARQGWRLEGTDLSPHLLQMLREYAPDLDLPLHACDVTEPDFAGPFDAVLGFFVLHHLGDLEGTFRAVRALLKPGGRAVFLEPNPWNPLFYVQILLWPNIRWEAEKGLLQMRSAVLDPAMRRAGLMPLPVRRFGFLPPFLRNTGWGGPLEERLERIPLLQPFLPFQLFVAEAEE